MKKNLLSTLAPLLLWSFPAFADSISEDVIFSDDLYAGAVSCSKLKIDDACEKPVPLYDAKGKSLGSSERLLAGCVQGGGDCAMAVFVTESLPAKKEIVLAKVRTASKKEAWIQVGKSDLKSVESFMPALGTGTNFISFRPSLTEVFLDRDLKKKIAVSDYQKPVDPSAFNDETDNIEHTEVSTFTRDGQKMIEVQVDKLTPDPEETNPIEADRKGKRTKIRTIYFPAYDSKGRINYWYQPGSC